MKKLSLIFLLLLAACTAAPASEASESTAVIATGISTAIAPTNTETPFDLTPSESETPVESNPEMPIVLDQDFFPEAWFVSVSADGKSGAFWQKSEHAERWYLSYWHDGDIRDHQLSTLMVHEAIVDLESLVMSADGSEVAFLVDSSLNAESNSIIVRYELATGKKKEILPTSTDYDRSSLSYSGSSVTWISNTSRSEHVASSVYLWDDASGKASEITIPYEGKVYDFESNGTSWAYYLTAPYSVVFHADLIDYPLEVQAYNIALHPQGLGMAFITTDGVYIYSITGWEKINDYGYMVVWSPEGDLLAFSAYDGVYLYSLGLMQSTKISNDHAYDIAYASNSVLVTTGQGIEVYYLEP